MPALDTFAPWFATAMAGVLHGLHPASGWPLMAACGLRRGGRWWRMLPAAVLGCAGLGFLPVAGLALVPALAGVCGDRMALADALWPALAALGLHLAAMWGAMLMAGRLAAYALRWGDAIRARLAARWSWRAISQCAAHPRSTAMPARGTGRGGIAPVRPR